MKSEIVSHRIKYFCFKRVANASSQIFASACPVSPGIVCLLPLVLALSSAISFATGIQRPYLYQIELNGQRSQILGTQHVGINLNEFEPHFPLRILSSRVLITEMVLTPDELNLWFDDYVSAILNYRDKYPSPVGEPLTDEEQRILIEEWKIPKKLVDVATSRTCAIAGVLAFPSQDQLDYQLQRLAYRLKKPLLALDTYELKQIAEKADEQKKGICDNRIMLRGISRKQVLDHFANLSESYRKGLETDFGANDDPGLKIRNLSWIPKLLPELKKGNAFIAVGVAHLYGKYGVIKLLEDQGANVHRIE